MSKTLVVNDGLNLETLGNILARSGFFADTRDAAQAIVKVLAGQELGFGPVASMTGVYIVKGKVALSANLMSAAVKRSGRYNYRVRTLTDTECLIEFTENGQAIGVSHFTMQDAAKAGLSSSENWKRYPRNMLFARALSNGVKWYCPDVTGGPVYTPDEMGAEVDADGEMFQPGPVYIEPEPEPEPDKEQRELAEITWTRDKSRIAKMLDAAEQMWAIPRPHALNRAAKALGLPSAESDFNKLADALAAHYTGSAEAAWHMLCDYVPEAEEAPETEEAPKPKNKPKRQSKSE